MASYRGFGDYEVVWKTIDADGQGDIETILKFEIDGFFSTKSARQDFLFSNQVIFCILSQQEKMSMEKLLRSFIRIISQLNETIGRAVSWITGFRRASINKSG